MDTIKVEPDSDSDCHQVCSQSDGYFDGLKQERQRVPEVTGETKEESWNVEEFLEVQVTTEEHEVRRKRMEQYNNELKESVGVNLHLDDRMRCDRMSADYSDCALDDDSQGKNLTVHKRVHSGEKPYGCDVCDERFSLGSTLKKHYRIHTGERPYKCDICSKAFRQGVSLAKHKRTHVAYQSMD
ncbi:hypothetical protein Cfor_12075 [Coptotermes formosanus]|uniref:C2H2-type domain-containing protein n=1 Tax=Coptotermes formosanus TaxID=36987 RepID=A0A6L2PW51_COPFO|nr:hypothetical protein Cfor_12075 [Coptotermes formosanus]